VSSRCSLIELLGTEVALDTTIRFSPETVPVSLGEPPGRSNDHVRLYGILVVDDEAFIRGLLNIALRRQGFAVWLAAGGQAAVDLYRRHHDKIDAVLMDVRMPVRDGPQTLAELRAINPEIACCFMSGDLGGYSAETLRDLGAAAMLRKPFHLDEVFQVLGKLTNGSSTRYLAPPPVIQGTCRLEPMTASNKG
jgi:CheY-like chemotaxis protein